MEKRKFIKVNLITRRELESLKNFYEEELTYKIICDNAQMLVLFEITDPKKPFIVIQDEYNFEPEIWELTQSFLQGIDYIGMLAEQPKLITAVIDKENGWDANYRELKEIKENDNLLNI